MAENFHFIVRNDHAGSLTVTLHKLTNPDKAVNPSLVLQDLIDR